MRAGRWGAACLAGALVIGLGLAQQGQDGQYGAQDGAAHDGSFLELDDPQLSVLEVDELPLTAEGVVDDDDWAEDTPIGGPILVDEDVQAIPDDRPEAFLDQILGG